MSRRGRWLLAVGALLVLVGVTLGALIPVSSDGVGGEHSCGSPWLGTTEVPPGLDEAVAAENPLLLTSNDFFCAEDHRQPRGTLALVVTVLGVTVAGSAFVVGRVKSPSGS